jgi:hypothetical protein
MCFVRSHNKQQLLSYTTLADWFCITEIASVYCAVRTESLYKKVLLVFKGLSCGYNFARILEKVAKK